MGFEIDLEGILTAGGGAIPEGKYNLRIIAATEKLSKKGDPMVVVDYEVMDGPYTGRHVKYHYVVFFRNKEAAGAGIAKHYLKVIGEPHDGNVTVNPERWVGKCLTAKVAIEKQENMEYSRVRFVDKYAVSGAPVANSDPDGAGVEVEDVAF